MKAFLTKTLSSRKFWAAVASSVPFAMAHDWHAFACVWMGYASIQGGVDVAEKLSKRKTQTLVTNNGNSD